MHTPDQEIHACKFIYLAGCTYVRIHKNADIFDIDAYPITMY